MTKTYRRETGAKVYALTLRQAQSRLANYLSEIVNGTPFSNKSLISDGENPDDGTNDSPDVVQIDWSNCI